MILSQFYNSLKAITISISEPYMQIINQVIKSTQKNLHTNLVFNANGVCI